MAKTPGKTSPPAPPAKSCSEQSAAGPGEIVRSSAFRRPPEGGTPNKNIKIVVTLLIPFNRVHLVNLVHILLKSPLNISAAPSSLIDIPLEEITYERAEIREDCRSTI